MVARYVWTGEAFVTIPFLFLLAIFFVDYLFVHVLADFV